MILTEFCDKTIAAYERQLDVQLKAFKAELHVHLEKHFQEKADAFRRDIAAKIQEAKHDFKVHLAQVAKLRQEGMSAAMVARYEEQLKNRLVSLLDTYRFLLDDFITFCQKNLL